MGFGHAFDPSGMHCFHFGPCLKLTRLDRWVCIGTVIAGICLKTLSRKDVKYSGSVILPTYFRRTASHDRMSIISVYLYFKPVPRLRLDTGPPSIPSIAIQLSHPSQSDPTEKRATRSSGLNCLKFPQSESASWIILGLQWKLTRPQDSQYGHEGAEASIFRSYRSRPQTVSTRCSTMTCFLKLNDRSSEFEHNIPYSLRCRAALLATPSRYPQLETAISASPEPSRMSLTISFQVSSFFHKRCSTHLT